MGKQFKTKNDLEKWIEDNFPLPELEKKDFFTFLEKPSEEEIAKKLFEEGYDLDNLTANGEGYQIAGHKNNGWFYAYKDELPWLESVGTDMSKVKVKD